jgi:hypothetical protein
MKITVSPYPNTLIVAVLTMPKFDVDEFTRRLGYNNRTTSTTRFGQMKRSLQEANSKLMDASNGIVAKPTPTKKRGAADSSGAKPKAKRAKKEAVASGTDKLKDEHLEEKDSFLFKAEE